MVAALLMFFIPEDFLVMSTMESRTCQLHR
jgi:hypothetical protein